MLEIIKIIIGLFILILGIFIGDFLARITKEELRYGQLWFKLIIIISIICGVVSLLLGNDVLLFSFLFTAIVTSRSLK
jgi:hypothetical protein